MRTRRRACDPALTAPWACAPPPRSLCLEEELSRRPLRIAQFHCKRHKIVLAGAYPMRHPGTPRACIDKNHTSARLGDVPLLCRMLHHDVKDADFGRAHDSQVVSPACTPSSTACARFYTPISVLYIFPLCVPKGRRMAEATTSLHIFAVLAAGLQTMA
jgi:hypothetical protein